MRHRRLTAPLLIATFATLALVSRTTHAASPPGEDAAIAEEVAQVLPHVPAQPYSAPAQPRQALLERFVDHLDLVRRLQSLHSLKLVSLWDSRRVSVFVGVDRHGMAGLQDPAVAARLLATNTLPDALPENLPPLRAVPLSSP